MAQFDKILKLLRTEKAMSQQDLADALGISKSAINMYERGERQPNFETLESIADYFNVDIDYLLGRTNKTTKIINELEELSTNILMNNTSKNEYKSYNNQLICFGKNEARKDFIDDMRKYYIMQKYQVGKNLFSINRTNCGGDLCKSIERVMFPLKKF